MGEVANGRVCVVGLGVGKVVVVTFFSLSFLTILICKIYHIREANICCLSCC